MRTKCLPLYLPGDIYARLEREAETHERDASQHARYLLKQALRAEDTHELARVPVEAGAA